MKKVLVPFLALSFLLAACNFSAGVDHDLKTGLTVKNSGLRYEHHTLTYNAVKAETADWSRGETLKLEFSGVSGFKQENDLIYPGISLTIRDANGKVKGTLWPIY